MLQLLPRLTNFTPVVVTLYKKENDFKQRFEKNGIQVVELDLPNQFFHVFRVKKYLSKLEAFQPALIHSTLFRSDLFARIIGRHLNVPVINSLVNNVYCFRRYRMEPWQRKIKLLFYQLIDFITAPKSDYFISNSASIADSYSKALLIPERKIKVIYRGRNLPTSGVSPHRMYPSGKGLNNPLVFLNVSRLLQRKEHRTLIIAFSDYLKINPNAELIICGEGPERAALERLIQKLNRNTKIRMVGNIESVGAYFEKSNFFVFPSLYEGLPGVLIEAMLAKIPIIASDIPENKECISADMVIFHQVQSLSELTKAMVTATQINDWRERTEKAFQRAMAVFDVAKIAQQYEEVYFQIITQYQIERRKA